LLEWLGAEPYLDPSLMATLWSLRQTLLAESGSTAADAMLVDLASLSYYHALRVQGWIGNLATLIEHEFFGLESPTATFAREFGRAEGLVVEDCVRRLSEQLLPLFDRANRSVIRNLKALKDLRRGPPPPWPSAGPSR
jgi:hypothetical protein